MKRHGIIVKPIENLGAVFNPAAAKDNEGNYFLLVRSVPKGYSIKQGLRRFEDDYTSHLSLWSGATPADKFSLVDKAAIRPDQPYDRFGVEDARITKIKDTWYICYTAIAIGLGQSNAEDGIRIALASTLDFKTFAKHGIIGPDQRSKAGTIFESGGRLHFMWKDEKGLDIGIERTMLSPAPADFENAASWKALWSDKTIQHHELLCAQNNNYENHGAEPGAPPIEIEEGLLTVYSSISSDWKWTISVVLLDKNDPRIILAKTDTPILVPEEDYELKGDIDNVVFPCGALIDNGRLYIYYGAADTVCAVASESLSEIRKALKPYKYKIKELQNA